MLAVETVETKYHHLLIYIVRFLHLFLILIIAHLFLFRFLFLFQPSSGYEDLGTPLSEECTMPSKRLDLACPALQDDRDHLTEVHEI